MKCFLATTCICGKTISTQCEKVEDILAAMEIQRAQGWVQSECGEFFACSVQCAKISLRDKIAAKAAHGQLGLF